MLRLSPIQIVKKVWGEELWIVNNSLYCLKQLILHPGFQSSLHWHQVKDETFLIDSGSCRLVLDGISYTLDPGDSKRIRPGVIHRFQALDSILCVILEVSTHHDDSDVVRLEESGKYEGR